MNGATSRRFWLILLGVTVAVSLVPAWFAWQAHAELGALTASAPCPPATARAPDCRSTEAVTVELEDRFTWRLRATDGAQALARLAPDPELKQRLRGPQPTTAQATWWRGDVVELDWGAGLVPTEAHPAARCTWYGSVFGAVYLLLAASALGTRLAGRRARG